MSGFPIVDLIVGMFFVYFLLSIICSSVVEMILTGLKARSKLLAEWLCKIFNEPIQVGSKTVVLGQAIMDHCAISGLTNKGKSPSYIDAKNFTSALLEKLTYNPNEPTSIANDLNTFINKIQQTDILSTELKRVFLTYAYEARDTYKSTSNKVVSEVDMFRDKIENWYDTSAERLTGDFKRRYSRPATLIVAAITVILMNADSVNIAKYLYSNPEARAKVAAQAYQAAQDSTQIFNQRIATLQNANDTTVKQLQSTLQTGLQNINDAKAAIQENLPFGWETTNFKELSGFFVILSKILGLIVTILAVMLGAPFWFDLLNKVTNLRGTGAKPASSAGPDNTLAASAAPVTVTINSNKDEEAVG